MINNSFESIQSTRKQSLIVYCQCKTVITQPIIFVPFTFVAINVVRVSVDNPILTPKLKSDFNETSPKLRIGRPQSQKKLQRSLLSHFGEN